MVPEMIMHQNHLLPLPPIKLPYTIRVDAVSPSSSDDAAGSSSSQHQHHPAQVYDIRVPLDDPLRARLTSLITNPAHALTLREITNLDDQLALTIQAIAHSKAKHGFFTAMSKDPAGFLRRWTSSQKRDLEVIVGEGARGVADDGLQGEQWRKGGPTGVWATQGVRESVELWLARGR